MTDPIEAKAADVLADVLDLPPAERSAAADRLCGGDARVRARVDTLLRAAEGAGDFLGDATVGPAGDATVGADAAPTLAPVTERPGSRIGRYKLLQQIGEGGFGVVFLAEQEHPVKRQVALKVIKLGMDTREVVARFEAERQALALMDHPNIARVFDAGSTDAGRPYFVMELVRGSPITEYADKHKLSTRDRVALAAAVCRAVQHAHGKGVIHRDLKPSNILVTVTDDKPVPKVIDFGIAKATQSKLTDRTLFTAHRQLIGTPQYMSPEQADSDGSDIDTRTDVYSLGVVLYELLVGTTPFDARQLRSAAFEAMRKMIREVEPPRPSTKLSGLGETLATVATNRGTDPVHLGRAIRGELDWIVMRALEKDRTRRYDTAAALADDLNRHLAGEAVLAGPVSGLYRLQKVARRYKAAVATGGAVAAVLVLGVAGTTWGLLREAEQRHVAEARQAESDHLRGVAVEAERRSAEQAAIARAEEREARVQKSSAEAKATEAKATLDFFTALLDKAAPAKTKDAAVSRVLVEQLITPALRTVGEQFGAQPMVRASIQDTLADTLTQLGRTDLAEPQAKAAWDARRRVLGADDPGALSALMHYARAIFYQGRHAEAERLLRQCYDARRRVLGGDHVDTLAALSMHALAVVAQGRHAEAERLFRQCWDASRRVLGDDHRDTLSALHGYAGAICGQGRFAEAERLYRQCWDASRRVLGDEHPNTLSTLLDYASATAQQGRYADAERLYKQVWDVDRRVLGDEHPATLLTLTNYANAIWAQGRSAEAERLYRQAWDASRRVLGDDHPSTLWPLSNLAAAVETQSRFGEAERLFKQCWEARRRLLGDDHPDTLTALGNLAETIAEQGRFAEAEHLARQCWDARRRVLGDDHPDALAALVVYASVIDRQGRPAEAERLCKRAWDGSRRVLGDDHPDTVTALSGYAVAIEEQGRHAEAEPLLEQVAETLRRSFPNDSGRGTALFALGQCLTAQGRWAEAEPVLRERLTWHRAHPATPRSPAELSSVSQLNACLIRLGKSPDATTAPVNATSATRPTG